LVSLLLVIACGLLTILPEHFFTLFRFCCTHVQTDFVSLESWTRDALFQEHATALAELLTVLSSLQFSSRAPFAASKPLSTRSSRDSLRGNWEILEVN
jgi:hypothetical protein